MESILHIGPFLPTAWLPEPSLTHFIHTRCEQILGNLITFHQQHPSSPLPEYPYRTLANAIINLAYRNGPIEEIHAGKAGTYSLTHRRMTSR